jgi:capsular polysaccharide biosynthesis protein
MNSMTLYSDDIDLRPYVLSLMKRWWIIVILTVLLSLAAYGFTLRKPPKYESTATIIINRSQLKLSIADQFPTITQYNDARYRNEAYLAIAQSASIAQATFEALVDKLPPNYSNFNSIKGRVEVEIKGDSISVKGSDQDPDLSAEIANTWAEQTAYAINLAYSGERPLSEIQSQIIIAENEYHAAQSALEEFIQTNRITVLEAKKSATQNLLTNLTADEESQIDYLYQRKQYLRQLIDSAEIIKEQINNGNASEAGDLGDALVVLNARANYFFSGSKFDVQLVNLEGLLDSTINYTKDIDDIIQIASDELNEINEEILGLSQETIETPADQAVEEIATQLRSFESELVNENARQRELTSERDLAWEAFQALREKETEILTVAETNPEVSLASPAIPPITPVASQTMLITLVGAAAGFMLASLWIIGSTWWRITDMPSLRQQLANKSSEK